MSVITSILLYVAIASARWNDKMPEYGGQQVNAVNNKLLWHATV